MKQTEQKSYFFSKVELDIVKRLAENFRDGANTTEIMNKTKYARSTVNSHLRTLNNLGLNDERDAFIEESGLGLKLDLKGPKGRLLNMVNEFYKINVVRNVRIESLPEILKLLEKKESLKEGVDYCREIRGNVFIMKPKIDKAGIENRDPNSFWRSCNDSSRNKINPMSISYILNDENKDPMDIDF